MTEMQTVGGIGMPFRDYDGVQRMCSNQKELTERMKVVQGFFRLFSEEVSQEFISDLKSEEQAFMDSLMSCMDGHRCGPTMGPTDAQFNPITRLRGLAIVRNRPMLLMAVKGQYQAVGERAARPSLSSFVPIGCDLAMESVDPQSRNVLANSVENLALFHGAIYGQEFVACFDPVLGRLRAHDSDFRNATAGYIVYRIELYLAYFYSVIFHREGNHLLPGYDNFRRPNTIRFLLCCSTGARFTTRQFICL
jgi:hypothetical protein